MMMIDNDCMPAQLNDNDQQHQVRRHGSTGTLTARTSGNGRITKPIPASRRMTEADLSKKRALFGALELFDGSPMYKQRRRRHRSASTAFHAAAASYSSSPAAVMMETPHHHWRSTTTPCDWMMEPPRAYTCPHCGNHFQQLELFDAHLRSHEREQPFMCCLCGKRFVCQYGLAEHQHVFHPFDSCCCCCCSWSPNAVATAPVAPSQPSQAVATPILDEDASSLVTSPCTPTSLFTPYMDPCWSASVASIANNKSAEYPNMWFTCTTTDDWMLQHGDMFVSSPSEQEQQQLPSSQTPTPTMISAEDWSIPLL